jgi:ribonucrease Y
MSAGDLMVDAALVLVVVALVIVIVHQARTTPAADADPHRDERLATERARLAERTDALRDDAARFAAEQERREQRLHEREDRLDAERHRIAERARVLDDRAARLERLRAEVADADAQRRRVLEQTASLSVEEARAELLASLEHDAKRAAAVRARDIERAAEREAESRARTIVTGAIQRIAADQTAESVVTVVQLRADDMKGRIIGREGRNIRAFESTTGVNLIIDDTPEAVLLSCFDPVRREIARLTLDQLLADGRIHPHRIEEVYERSRRDVEDLIQRAGQDAVLEMGITDLHPKLITYLGRLKYRTSYGQNVLGHLLECGHLAAAMAAELGLDAALCRRCAFLHDVGKALTHEIDGSHAIAGAELARKYGEGEDVVHAIEAHHNEVEPRTVEAVLTQAADAISGGRPGARRESLEAYVKRLERLEQIATARDGVDRVFAMQAGRELRVMVLPDQVDDIHAQVIARDIAKQVEEELTYPGQIRVTVVRESRATEYAR